MKQIKISETQYFRQLDGFRFLCISAVMFSHFGQSALVDRFPFGFGVEFFFVISSFLITRILLVAKDANIVSGESHFFSLKQFYFRRFLRIFPVYYFLISFLYMVNWVPIRDVIVYLLTYTTNFRIGAGFDAGNFNHLWSLAVEEQFYILFPFFIFFINSEKLLKLFVCMIAIGLLGRCCLFLYDKENIPFSNFNTISCLDSLGIGSVLAYFSIYKKASLEKIIGNRTFFHSAIAIFLLAMIVSFSALPLDSRFNIFSMVVMRFLFNVMSFWILGKAVVFGYGGNFGRFLEWKPVVYLGRISYGIYLYHLFVPQFTRIALGHFKIYPEPSNSYLYSWSMGLLHFLVTIVIASASWFLLEKPLNGFKKYFSYNKSSKAVVQNG